MRSLIKSLVVISLFIMVTGNAFAQQYIGDVKVKSTYVQTPQYQVNAFIDHGQSSNERWLQIDINYKTKKESKMPWMDDLVMKYDVLLPKTGGRTIVLSGKIEYWSVAMDGKVHHAQAYIHPKFLKRYAPGLKLRNSELKNLRINISFVKNDSVIGKGVYKPRTSSKEQTLWNEVQKALGNMRTTKVKDSIFPRNETPWCLLNVTYYELIKRKN